MWDECLLTLFSHNLFDLWLALRRQYVCSWRSLFIQCFGEGGSNLWGFSVSGHAQVSEDRRYIQCSQCLSNPTAIPFKYQMLFFFFFFFEAGYLRFLARVYRINNVLTTVCSEPSVRRGTNRSIAPFRKSINCTRAVVNVSHSHRNTKYIMYELRIAYDSFSPILQWC
jgi:hypothetical protein